MKHTTFVLVLLTILCTLPLFAAPDAPTVAEGAATSRGPAPFVGHYTKPRIVDPGVLENSEKANDAILQGEALLKQGHVNDAVAEYQSAMQYLPNDPLSLQRIAEAYAGDGRLAEADQAYYKLFHEAKWQSVSGNPTAFLGYALVLVKTHQPAEAAEMYNHEAYLVDYKDTDTAIPKPFLRVLFPEVVMGEALPDQVAYTPEHLQALADALLAYKQQGFWSDKEVLAHIQEAVKLYPDSPVTHYYQGEVLFTKDRAGAKAAYQKAADLGDDKTAAAAKEKLTMIR